jgi:hypothetical protein
MPAQRMYPLRELTPKLAATLRRGSVRTCLSLHECCLCDRPIAAGQRYYDAGLRLRAHVGDIDLGCPPGCTCAEG